MTQLPLFALIFVLMLGLASVFVVWPLWRVQQAGEGVTRTKPTAPSSLTASPSLGIPKRWPAIWLATNLSIASVGVYTLVGEPDALLQSGKAISQDATSNASAANLPPEPSAVTAPDTPPDTAPNASAEQGAPQIDQARIEAMVNGLAQRLQRQPQDPKGWRMLAKSYETLGRFDNAANAYQQLLKQQAPDPDLLTDYAVTLGMSKGQTLAGEPEALIKQALQLNPKHIQALALAGSAAFEQQDYRRAVSHWQTLLNLIPQDADLRPSIERHVEKARSLIR